MRKIVAVILGLVLILTSPLPALAFSDTNGHWAAVSINHLASREIVKGKTSQLFVPEGAVTRAEFATLLVNGLGLSGEAAALKQGVCRFRDVPTSFWAKGSLELCRELGIMIPDITGRCYPNRVISRGEAAVMVTKALRLSGSGDITYTDSDKIPDWAQEAARAVWRHKIMNGFPDGSFRAQSTLTRAQAVITIENVLDYHGDKYMAVGTLISFNQSLHKSTIRINGKNREVDLAKNFSYTALELGPIDVPAYCYFDFDQAGDLVFCQETARDETSNLVITTKAQPTYIKSTSTVTSYSLMPETGTTTTNNIDPRTSSQVNKSVVKADELQNAVNTDGKGVRVAIIDTGIDPGHPDLVTTPEGKNKIMEWLDLTQEGKVALQAGSVVGGKLVLSNKKIDLSGIKSIGGRAYFGYFDKSILPAKIKAGNASDILVVALDSQKASVFDTVLIDTNGNGSLSDEKPLNIYKQKQDYSSFTTDDGKAFNFIVSEISPVGSYVKFGFDSNGHGTKMAGIIAGNGLVQGVAPGAQLLAVKVFDSFGNNEVDRLEEAIKIVGNMDVDVVNISMGYLNLPEIERQELENVINTISKEKGIVFCIAVGNMGPGLGSIAYPSNASQCIGVGGYISPEIWMFNYGWKIEQSTLWQFSSVGPNEQGKYPFIVAPASAVSTDVCWREGYSLDEGTSIATPYATGGAALLIGAARKEGIRFNPQTLRQAIAAGADPIGQYQPCEVGHGSLNLLRAWDALKKQPAVPVTVTQGDEAGLFARNNLPAQSWLKLSNSGSSRFIELSTSANWIQLGQDTVQVPSQGLRTVALRYSNLKNPGLYSSLITGDDPTTNGIDMEVLETTIIPYTLQGNGGGRLLASEQLPAGMYKRYFIKIPQGKGKLNIKINIPKDSSGKYLGRVRLHLVSPNGELQESTGYAGSGYPDSSPLESISVNIDNPQAGVWELVVFSAVTISQYDLSLSKFSLESGLVSWTDSDPISADDRYVISSTHGSFQPGYSSWITLHFWDNISNVAAEGKVVINNMLYELSNGQVRLQVLPAENKPVLEITW